MNVFFGLIGVLYAALVVYGGWLCWGEAMRGDENERRSGPRTAAAPRQPRADAVDAAARHAVQEPTFNPRETVKFLLYPCLAITGIACVLVACTDIDPTGSPAATAVATEGAGKAAAGTPARREGAATPSRASFNYFPENYVNRGRDGDGNVMTYEHD